MNRKILTTVVPLFLIAACSSGGGGFPGSGGGNNNPPSAALSITAANGLQVAQIAYQSAMSAGDIAGTAGGVGPTGGAGGGLAKPSAAQYFSGTLAGMLQKVPVGPTVLDCLAGGTVTVTMDLVDPTALLLEGTLTATDTIQNVYAACDEGLGEVIDGTVDAVVVGFSGNILSNAYDITMTMDLIDFQVTTAEDVLTVNGDGTAVLNSLASPYVEASISGSAMTTDSNSGTETLTSYSSAQSLDAGLIPAPYTLTGSGTLDNSRLAGSITYSTPVTLEGEDANYPDSGEFLIAGDGSSARLIAQANAVDIVIEIYSNATGTGTPDDAIMTTWAELAGM